MKFEFPMMCAELSKVNPRAEFHGDEKELAMDLSISFECNVDVLNNLCKDEEPIYFGDILHDSKGMLRSTGLESLVFSRVFEDHTLGLSMSGLFNKDPKETQFFKQVRIKGIKATPLNHNAVRLSFKAQLNPIEKDIAFINLAVLKPCYVSLSGPNVLEFGSVEEESNVRKIK